MNNTAKDYFADWYKSGDLEISAEIIAMRIMAIEKLVDNEDINFWLDMVRIYLGVNPQNMDNREYLVREFKQCDPTFPILANENVLKVLTSILLCFKLEENEYEINNIISLAIINSNFLGQYDVNTIVQVVEFAQEHASHAADRSVDFQPETKKLEAINTSIKTLSLTTENVVTGTGILVKSTTDIIEALNTIITANKNLAEETNVLWWIFGEHSKIMDASFKKVTPVPMTIIGAKELFDITTLGYCFSAADQFLSKVISLASNGKTIEKNISVFEAINSLSADVRENIFDHKTNGTSELTPCLAAMKKSLEFEVGEDWSGPFGKQNFSGNIKKDFKLIAIATQFYRELSYINYFN